MLALSASYSFGLAAALSAQGALDLLPLLMSMTAVFLCAVFSLFGAQGILFNTRDMDMALSWPVPPVQLVLSRLLALYLENLFLLGLWMLPVWLAWMWQGGCAPAAFVAFPVGVVLLTFLPCLLSMAAGFVMALIAVRFNHKALVENLLYLVLFIGIIAGSFVMQGAAFQVENSVFSSWPLLPFRWFTGVLKLRDFDLAALAAVCLVPFLLVSWAISLRYTAILTLLATRQARFAYSLTQQRASGRMRALIRREFRRYFSISIYLFNTGIGLLLLAAAAVAAAVQRSKLHEWMAELALDGLSPAAALALLVGFVLAMTQPTTCSISLEGAQLWILKSAPLRPTELFGGKILMQLLLVLPFVAVCVPVLGWALEISAVQILCLLFAAAGLALCVAPMGLLVNLCFPKLDAPNPTVVVKQSAATLTGLLAGFALLVPGTLLYLVFPLAAGGCAWPLAAGALYLMLAAILWNWLVVRGPRLLDRL